ncbi:MAG TPA: 4'-phosphopantetheinyl transferase superfamily protein [Vicinamibacterales bacterium]
MGVHSVIGPRELHVVCFPLDQPVNDALSLLDEIERTRAARFVFERDRRRFIAAHAWVRITLAGYLDLDPASLRFATGSHGKPYLVDAPIDLRHNLSHAGDRALLAVALGHDVGVDIEGERAIDVPALSRRFFAPAESEAIRELPEAEQLQGFLRCWTRKEAFIKARGDGLAFPLSGFEVSLADAVSPQTLTACAADPGALLRWRVAGLAAESGYTAAVAHEIENVRLLQWNAGSEVTPAGREGSGREPIDRAHAGRTKRRSIVCGNPEQQQPIL